MNTKKASALYRGDYAMAQRKSAEARKWVKWNLILGVISIILWVIIVVACIWISDAHVFKSHPGMP